MKDFNKFLGKRIRFTDSTGNQWVGICNFIGINKFLQAGLQITIGRMPIWPVDPTTIELAPLPPRLFPD
tara:strand:+ start:1233 stop:1439 length:207 start_codon:yes stop_codon:yes gene_type:complete